MSTSARGCSGRTLRLTTNDLSWVMAWGAMPSASHVSLPSPSPHVSPSLHVSRGQLMRAAILQRHRRQQHPPWLHARHRPHRNKPRRTLPSQSLWRTRRLSPSPRPHVAAPPKSSPRPSLAKVRGHKGWLGLSSPSPAALGVGGRPNTTGGPGGPVSFRGAFEGAPLACLDL